MIRNCLRRYEVDEQLEREELDVVGPGGLTVHPHVWPTGLHAGCVVTLLLWSDQGVQAPRQNVAEDVRQRDVDARQREDDARDRERHARERESDARERERDARERERDARERERAALAREQDARDRDARQHGEDVRNARQRASSQPQHTDPARDTPSISLAECTVAAKSPRDLEKIRKHQACLSFFAGHSRLRDFRKHDQMESK